MINLTDVTLRDGLQSESLVLPTKEKAHLYHLLSACSFSRLEITSFSHPKWIPALADSEALCAEIFKAPSPPMELMAFIPNEKGLERSSQYPIKWASFFTAASETFHQKNVNMTQQAGLEQLKATIESAHQQKRKCRVYISTVFGCPYEGEISDRKVVSILEKVVQLNPDEIALSDTIGVATPQRVKQVCSLVQGLFPVARTALHVHNTYGLALANIATAFEAGVNQFDGSTGGLGGCPYAKGASGNVASEEILYFFYRQGVLQHVNWDAINQVLQALKNLGFSLQSHLATVLTRGGALYGVK